LIKGAFGVFERLEGPVARSSLRGGGGELGKLKLGPMAPTICTILN